MIEPRPARAIAVALVFAACGGASPSAPDAHPAALTVTAVAPAIVDPAGGSTIVVRGAGFTDGAGLAAITAVTIGGVPATRVTVRGDAELEVLTAAVPAGPGLDLEVQRADRGAALADALEAWSPANLPGARLFDASHGVTAGTATTQYEWQRLTANLGDDWRARDGDTLTWLPATGRYWMVGGWNGLLQPDGFAVDPPEITYPPQNTTNEVWSSADGLAWRAELSHDHAQFERRHSHNTVVWHDAMWMIGGDTHQGRYNHDVVSSPDGVTWTVRLGPGTTPPPWTPRALQVSGVYAGKLWMVGGQDGLGDPAEYVYHNDVWNTDDGVHWTQVAADAPASPTRWAGCGVLDGLVEFRGRMWLVGCARERSDSVGHAMSSEIWSTTDGVTWTRHADGPWVGKIWPNVVVWDDRMWILFGYTKGDAANGFPQGNANEAWYSDDGETWTVLPLDAPVPGSHAQGVAARDDALLLAGGNYTFGGAGIFDKSVWRLVPKRGVEVTAWRDRGTAALAVAPPEVGNAPVRVDDAFGPGRPGLEFDGSRSFLALPAGTHDAHPDGLSVFWVARAPYSPAAIGWSQVYTPATTVVGGEIDGGYPRTSVGFTNGRLVAMSRGVGVDELGSPRWAVATAGDELQRGPGEPHLAGMTLAADGTIGLDVDGAEVGAPVSAPFDLAPAWSRIGAGIDGAGEGPLNRFAGSLGAVVIVPTALDATTRAKLHGWAQGRFGTP